MHCIIVAKAREYPISFQPSYSISNKALLGYRRYKSKLKARVSTAKYIVCTRAIALLFAALQRNTTLYSFFFLGRKIIDTLCIVVVAQSLIIPLFTKGHLYTVFLQKVENTVSE